eukprot:CAMPEP_0202865850 /NCGR_PEP_ID=MMETSP1391-20130828/6550_1 /ASSEMBLY_ACC=CAM_ASM_000867 /TAXON_ID=1034604 /ORGANISM="Chlamydomonas leiostraca, Strain SAG 11-49" /LENGTH=302 /DNA_ID=CAMNT_0049545731 /DNA_START=42 /DNA_END=950 /DNA_ORIENTATION=+
MHQSSLRAHARGRARPFTGTAFTVARPNVPVAAPAQASPSSTRAQSVQALPSLAPLDANYEKAHTFADFANWAVPGSLLLGRYPYCEPSRCAHDHAKGEAQLQQILEAGITTFVSLQAEVPAQDKMKMSGVDGFLPYKATAELIKSALSPPPPMEIVEGLRNPTLDKFLPKRKRETARDLDPEIHERFVTPSYTLNFLHMPVTDLSIPDATALKPLVDDLLARLDKGEKLYVHCWGGRGRAGTVGAIMLALGYGVSVDEALERVQRSFNTRQDNKERSPETDEQHAFVRSFVKQHAKVAAKH